MKRLLIVLLFAIPAMGQNVPYSDIALSSSGRPVGGAPIAVCSNPGLTTTSAQVISNIAVLTMSSNPITAGYVANQAIAVSGFTGADTYFNGGTVTSTGITNNFLILSVSSTQITYALTHANASATTNGSVFQAGSQGQACAPLSPIFADPAGASPITQPGLTSTGLGNYQFYAAPNSYYVQFFGATIGEILKPVVLPPSTVNGTTTLPNLIIPGSGSLTVSGAGTFTGATTIGNGNSFSLFTFSNHNGIPWSGPGSTPTIDQDITFCGTNPCLPHIAPTYSGAESTLLTATSIGYNVAALPNNQTVVDMRANACTPSTPTCAPIYSIGYGGREIGELVKLSVNNWCNSPNDSCVGQGSTGWTQGTFPSNGGAQIGASCVDVLHDTVTIGSSISPVVGCDGEAWVDFTTVDKPLTFATGNSGQVLMNRNNVSGFLMLADAYHANQPSFGSSPSANAFIDTAYGFDGDRVVNSANLYGINYGFHSAGGYLDEFNQGGYDFFDATAAITSESESGTTATYTMAATCFYTTGQKVRITGATAPTGVSNGPGYNVSGTVLTPGCNGGSTFTMTLKQSGLGAATGGTAQGIHSALSFPADNTITSVAGLDSAGWRWALNTTVTQMKLNSGGLQVAGNIGCVSAGGCFFGENTNTEGAGLGLREGGAFTGVANDTICQAVSSTHTLQCSYNNGPAMNMQQVVSTSFTTTAATTDNVTVTGMTSTGHCYLTPTNSGAAGGIASVFISAKTTNQITVTHTATSGWTFDVVCTPQ